MSFIPPAGGSPPHHRVGGEHDGKNMMGSHFSGSERERDREEEKGQKSTRGCEGGRRSCLHWMRERHRDGRG